MAEKIPMIALSPTMETGQIVKWRKKEGEAVKSGEVLCEVETDKATMEYEATAEGTLLKVLVGEGASAAVGQPIAIIGSAGEDISSLLGEEARPVSTPAEEEQKMAAARQVETEERPEAAPGEAQAREAEREAKPGEVRASPLARKLAEKYGINLEEIQGSGPRGRVVEKDVELAQARQAPAPAEKPAAAPPTPLKEEIIKVTEKRKVIAQRLSESAFTAPHYFLRLTAVMDNLLAARERLNAGGQADISLNSFLIKLAAETLKRHPLVNATWRGDTIVQHGRIDVALAVAQESGLVTPVIRNCESKGILAIDQELRGLVDKARAGKLAPEEYRNSTFTITNLGMMGIEEFTAIINPPNSAILAVGAIAREPRVGEHDQLAIQSVMRLTLACDHRILDGAVGAAFLRDLKEIIESPIKTLY